MGIEYLRFCRLAYKRTFRKSEGTVRQLLCNNLYTIISKKEKEVAE